MQEPANMPLDVICQLEEMKQVSRTFQFQSIYDGESALVALIFAVWWEVSYRDLAHGCRSHSHSHVVIHAAGRTGAGGRGGRRHAHVHIHDCFRLDELRIVQEEKKKKLLSGKDEREGVQPES